ncbi:voltage-dependent L-type calcium channel subunit alpha-1D-like protein [Labeo rohita]|uniref:Voltage-dependent L-type calcium channel subunit alpha-1D-like protein n=1 Tax=Labeo rohita TaxID=84645 RepID=A0A498P3Z5_LABRO|nr:voltage-dependent L-type calcium channel subunit alpha-1D-like protein [Labeo rohita]RXN38479.1 voltage-dependent L-type calcium channel subunit alpha-1D-like protein [Labeo rohita]
MEAFDESVEPWTTYIERFEHFVEANSIDADKKVPVLLSVIGRKTYGLLRSLIAPDKPREKSFKQIKDTLQQHFSPKPLIIAERFRFHRRSQEESESVTQYVAVLTGLSEHCEFGGHLDDALRDRFVCGLKSEATQKRLLTETTLTFRREVELAVSMETASREAHQLGGSLTVNVFIKD